MLGTLKSYRISYGDQERELAVPAENLRAEITMTDFAAEGGAVRFEIMPASRSVAERARDSVRRERVDGHR